MSLIHLFLKNQTLEQEEKESFLLDIDTQDTAHLKALRIHAQEHIAVVDASSDYFECEVISFDKDGLCVKIAGHLDAPQHPFSVTLIQGLAKGEKMDTVIRHATELGVDAFVPFKASRSVVRLNEKKAQTRTQRWQTIAQSASQQSGRISIPKVNKPVSLNELLPELSAFDAVLVFWEEASDTIRLKEALSDLKKLTAPSIAVVIGPEGGLEQQEVSALLSSHANAHLLQLGPYILRTETAGIVASALTIYEMGGLGGACCSKVAST